ncbi:hypothetical protein PENANT_c059G06191 [Penicillium antarcticum]|uniref:non-specific serine/threonine protein kinase n=1 Tax=Penicillium antarcticum TaxID=416450 RepID=A0A1V6PR42_9EURO|nr:uncharacterized protein N7508_001712 [Penicillium antarcticum]KAJ5317204.1 hypothetical protein N7508_001712 [Penicillium antarcticum]OQD79172.1 hypothetical protein PENANT_c059G06191 [Penicillium antarcticum]
MESRSTTKSVTQRRVYGKRRANTPRAVFDQASPARNITPKKAENVCIDAVESLEAKLARVTIGEDQASQPDEKTEREEKGESKQNHPLSDTISEQSSPCPETESPDISVTPSIESTPECPELKQFESMIEVRICKTATADSSDATSESASGDQGKRNAAERKAPRRKISVSRRSSGIVHDNKFNDYVRSILDEALAPIAAQSIQKFSSWASRSANMFDVAKLAEGSYGEVYKLHLREEACRPVVSKSKLAKLKSYGDGVFKVVPLRAKSGPGSKKFTSIDEIVAEVKMLKYLDPIPGFARFREIHVVQGRFPESFQNAWDHYKKTKDDCMNPNPSNKRAYPDTQLWAIIEMDDAGCELEKFAWSSIFQIYDIFWGVAMALARAEEYALFEHRDLHLGNVCIRSTRRNGCMDPPTEQDITSQSCSSGFGFSSIETTIIDYSLSRAELRWSDDPNGPIEVASSDLDKKQLFDAVGQDEDEIMQRNTYRYMRATLYTGDPAETGKPADIPGIWAEYSPRTNLVWLLFLLQSLFKNRKPEPAFDVPQRKALAPCSPNKKTIKAEIANGKDQKVASSLVKEQQTQACISRLKSTLEDRLKSVLKLLDLEHGHEDMCCAADLVAYAMDSQWLGEEDFF